MIWISILDKTYSKNISHLSLPSSSSKLGAFCLYCITFFYCLGPVLNSYSSIIDFIFFTSIFLSLYFFIKIKLFPPPFLKIFLILVPIFFYIVVSAVFYSEAQLFDFIRLSLKPVRIITTLLGGFALVALFLRLGRSLSSLYLFIFMAIVLHALIMILQLYSPDFKDLIYSFTTSDSIMIESYSYEYNFRMGGLAGSFGSSTLSVAQAFGIILLPFIKKGRGFWQRSFLNLCAVIIFFSVIICGRSGLLFILLFYPLSSILVSGGFKISNSGKLVFLSLGLLGLIAAMVTVIGNLDETSDLFYALRRTFETLIALDSGGKIQDGTFNTILTFMVLPNSPEGFILGSSEFLINTHFDRTLNSDIGYIRNLWGMGIFVALAYWMPYFYFLFKAYLNQQHLDSAKILLVIVLMSILLHVKEDIFYSRILLSYFSIILAMFYFEKNPKNKYVRN